MKIGIVGLGYVGGAVNEVFKNYYNIETFDINKECTCKSLVELVEKTDVIFVCVNTPMNRDGSCNTKIINRVICDIDFYAGELNKTVTICLKSTVPPGTTAGLNMAMKNSQVIFNPEFLREISYLDDFKNQTRIIIGGPRPGTTIMKQVFLKIFPDIPIIKTSSTISETVKYITNTFLATKVAFANEFYQLCKKLKIDYDKVIEYSLYDDRLGNSHWGVPGPDGHFGFGGSCFPKDLNALLYLIKQFGLEDRCNVLDAVWRTNLQVRPERDWERLVGRAIVDENNEKKIKE